MLNTNVLSVIFEFLLPDDIFCYALCSKATSQASCLIVRGKSLDALGAINELKAGFSCKLCGRFSPESRVNFCLICSCRRCGKMNAPYYIDKPYQTLDDPYIAFMMASFRGYSKATSSWTEEQAQYMALKMLNNDITEELKFISPRDERKVLFNLFVVNGTPFYEYFKNGKLYRKYLSKSGIWKKDTRIITTWCFECGM